MNVTTMKANELHSWDIDEKQAIELQSAFAPLVERHDRLSDPMRHIAGVDVAYGKYSDKRVFAAVVIIDIQNGKTIETSTYQGETEFPYIPGLFAFRELPPLLKAFEKISCNPDLIICDGQGIAHPRRFGIACHLGVLFDVPAIGCGKTCLLGEFQDPDFSRGSTSYLVDKGETIGMVVRTQDGVKPMFVSVGHRISLESAAKWIIRLAEKYRQPEPIRRANELACHIRNQATLP
jgi:deoxyribonuclease V